MLELNFVGVGPQRTASSWLHVVLAHHPSVAFPAGVKETMFFDQRFDKGLSWYEWHFRHATEHQVVGEIAPTYFDHTAARERLRTLYPELRIIINVRNPVERAHSLYRHHRAKGRVSGTFREAVHQQPSILSAGHYRRECEAWEALFGTDHVLYVVQEDVSSNPGRVLDEVCAFLGLRPIDLPTGARGKVNEGTDPRFPTLARMMSSTATLLRGARLHWLAEAGKRLGLTRLYSGGRAAPPLDPTLEHELAAMYDDDISWLERRLNRSFSSWRNA